MGAAAALVSLLLALMAGTVPTLFGMDAYVVLSGSMEPAIHVGDLAVVAPTKPEAFMVGDVITYRTADRPDIIVTHRVVNIGLDENGQMTFQTKGDANANVDSVSVAQGAVLGRVVYAIPRIGYLVEFSKRPEGKVVFIGIPGLLLAFDYFLRGRRRTAAGAATSSANDARESLARGRAALLDGDRATALAHLDRAIALDPHLEEAWVLKARCIDEPTERVSCLRAGLTVNPGAEQIRQALDRALALDAAQG